MEYVKDFNRLLALKQKRVKMKMKKSLLKQEKRERLEEVSRLKRQ